jgi:hypothetical protein
MALWTVAFLVSTPIGGQHAGPPWALALGGASARLAAAIGAVAMVPARCPRTAARVRRQSPAQYASGSDDTSGE